MTSNQNVNPFTPPSVERLETCITFEILKIYLKCLLGFGPKDSSTSSVNQKREVAVMEVKGSIQKRMFCPISRGPNPLERGRVLGHGGSLKPSWKEGLVYRFIA